MLSQNVACLISETQHIFSALLWRVNKVCLGISLGAYSLATSLSMQGFDLVIDQTHRTASSRCRWNASSLQLCWLFVCLCCTSNKLHIIGTYPNKLGCTYELNSWWPWLTCCTNHIYTWSGISIFQQSMLPSCAPKLQHLLPLLHMPTELLCSL